MKKIILALFFALLFSAATRAASLYILYEPACMDRLEYVSLNGDDKSEYVVYHVNTSPGVKVVLEVGRESTTSQDFPPAQVIKCNNAVFDEKLVNAINSNIEKVFMVVKKGNNRYFISPITFAARYLRSEDFILYDSPKYRFQFDTKLGTIGENIAYKNPKAEVHFEGMLQNECSGTLLFRQKAEFAGNPHTEMELIPEVGIVEERSGINAADARKNILRLEKVNGKKLDRYLRQICQGIEEPEETQAAADDSVPADEFLAVEPRIETLAPKGEAAPAKPVPAAAPAAAKSHKVKKGETLYRISKQYNVTVDQLRAWNNKGNSNTIYAGENLQVVPPAAASLPSAAAATREGQIQLLGSPKGYEPAGTPAAQPAAAGRSLSEKGIEGKYHIVQPGETVALIAMRYGYTEKRFREFNNLGPSEVAKAGQALRTTECDCPQAPAAPASQGNAATIAPDYGPGSYSSTQSRVYTTRTGAGSATPNSSQPAGPEESFYEDDLGANRNYAQEYNYRNTPLFLDRTSPPPPAAPRQPALVPPATAPASTSDREYSPDGSFYSVTGGRIDSKGTNEATTNTPYTGIISGTFSNRPPVAGNNTAREYSNTSYQADNRARTVYVVKEGDTLFRIARMHGLTVERLRALNNLGANEVIIPYQKIYLN